MQATLDQKQGYESLDFLHFAKDHYASSICLINRFLDELNSSYIDSAIYLGHLAIELLLKSIALEKHGKFIKTHKLVKLYQDAGVSISSEMWQFLGKLDSFCEHR